MEKQKLYTITPLDEEETNFHLKPEDAWQEAIGPISALIASEDVTSVVLKCNTGDVIFSLQEWEASMKEETS